MIPLFMAGDKEFYQLGRILRKETGVDLTIFCSGHLLEQGDFWVGFCGVDENVAQTARMYDYNYRAKFQLASWYFLQYLLNPSYCSCLTFAFVPACS